VVKILEQHHICDLGKFTSCSHPSHSTTEVLENTTTVEAAPEGAVEQNVTVVTVENTTEASIIGEVHLSGNVSTTTHTQTATSETHVDETGDKHVNETTVVTDKEEDEEKVVETVTTTTHLVVEHNETGETP